ncbi:hypothetical protein J3B02_001824 [Coemansia erecta]|nr:hypothetical protein J3B02_001824 [Coemansia erecta]
MTAGAADITSSHLAGYADGSEYHSPVPSLTHGTSRASSASSSSVSSMSPGALAVATPRDLAPPFVSSLGRHGGDATAKKTLVATGQPGTSSDGGDLKRRSRESEEDADNDADTARAGTAAKRQKMRKHASSNSIARSHSRKRLTGSADFVKQFGLADLYDQYVRPYVLSEAGSRREMPDLASAYLCNVRSTIAAQPERQVDLMALVLAPPKNEFDHLDLLPMASIKAAFSIAPGAAANKRSRISLKCSTDTQPRSPSVRLEQQPGSNSGSYSNKVGIGLSTIWCFFCATAQKCIFSHTIPRGAVTNLFC